MKKIKGSMKKKISICFGMIFLLFSSFAQVDTVTVETPIENIDEKPLNKVYEFPDIQATYESNNGSFQDYISKSVIYPEESIKKREEGVVYVAFIVNKNGSISNAIIEKGVSVLLDIESIRVIENSPKWKAAKNNGKRVRSIMRIPINFKL